MTTAKHYVLDANVFIEAHKRYYACDICPGFWDAILHYHKQGCLYSIDRVKQELSAHKDALSRWVQKEVPGSFFVETTPSAISTEFGKIMTWVKGQTQYLAAATNTFANGADGWLIAYAKVAGFIVATQEKYDPHIKKRVPIPNVCNKFGVDYIDTFKLLRDLGAEFRYRPKR